MILKCLGSETWPHEEVNWLATNEIDAHCWYCMLEGRDKVFNRPASEVSVIFRGKVKL